jgi:hypothetical protein
MTRMDRSMMRNLMLVKLPFAKMPKLRSLVNLAQPGDQAPEVAKATLRLMEIKSFTVDNFRLKGV